MNSKKLLLLAAGLTGIFLLSACEETDMDRIADAQFCMDKARDGASAQACLSKIEGLHSASAYVLRCSSEFIAQGFSSAQKLSTAMDQISSDGAGTTALLGALTFTDVASANRAFSYCELSGQKGMTLLAAMSRSATLIASSTAGLLDRLLVDPEDLPSQTDIETAINSMDPDNIPVLGGTIKSVYQTTCNTGSPANKEICGEMTDALAGLGENPTDEEVGQALLDLWLNQ